MTRSTLHSLETDYSSVTWVESHSYKGARFAIRRVSLQQRIEIARRVRELTLQNEFLRNGDVSEQLDAVLGELLAKRVYLEWGLADVQGFTIDGVAACPALLIEKGPESLAEEIVAAVIREFHLTDEERKNS